MSRNQIWRAAAYAVNTREYQDEVSVFVDAPDRETAKRRIYERLATEWSLDELNRWSDKPARIEFYNLWSGEELCDMASGPQVPPGLPLLESGVGNGMVYYDHEPLILVASARLREVLECALREVSAIEEGI